MNPRVSLLLWTLVFVVASYGLYRVKYQVLGLRSEIASVSRELEQERENLHASAAEWTYLTRPDRLERLSDKYLRLQPMQPAQMARLSTIDARFAQQKQNGSLQAASAQMPVDAE